MSPTLPSLFYEIVGLIGSLLALIGMLALGVAIAWLLLTALKRPGQHWPYYLLLFVVFFGAGLFLLNNLTYGAIGLFTLGFAGGIFYFGINQKDPAEKKAPPVKARK
jgi:threonine/homoserine efflux transporter RhtA